MLFFCLWDFVFATLVSKYMAQLKLSLVYKNCLTKTKQVYINLVVKNCFLWTILIIKITFKKNIMVEIMIMFR